MSLEQLESRLTERFRILTGGSRTALPRQQTMRALVDWSYDLLTEDEKTLFRRVAAFAGGWSLDAASAVCSDAKIEEWAVLDLLQSLVDKSMVVAKLSGPSSVTDYSNRRVSTHTSFSTRAASSSRCRSGMRNGSSTSRNAPQRSERQYRQGRISRSSTRSSTTSAPRSTGR